MEQQLIKNVRIDTKTADGEDVNIIDKVVERANKLYKSLQNHIKKDPTFKNASETDRVNWMIDEDKEFQKKFPIVARYMVMAGIYSEEAFRLYVKKLQSQKSNMVRIAKIKSEEEKELAKKEEWCRTRAFYAKYLYAVKTREDDIKNNACKGNLLKYIGLPQAKYEYVYAFKRFMEESIKFHRETKEADAKIAAREKKQQDELAEEFYEQTKSGNIKLNEEKTLEFMELLYVTLHKKYTTAVISQFTRMVNNQAANPNNGKIWPKYTKPLKIVNDKLSKSQKRKRKIKKQIKPGMRCPKLTKASAYIKKVWAEEAAQPQTESPIDEKNNDIEIDGPIILRLGEIVV